MRLSRICLTAAICAGFAAAPAIFAQNIRVDATPSHSTNTIKPTEALGAGIDRLPYGAADKLFVDDTIKQILSAGWQTVTYRQNTELHIEAWHWNPQGTWSDPAGKGYFVGNATPGTEMVRHSYGYPLPHRGVTRDDGTDTEGYSRLELSSAASEAYMDIWGGLWLADYIGAFLSGGGNAVYYFHYMPEPIGNGHNGSPGTFSFFSADRDYKIKQPLSQYFVSQMLNLEWVQPGDKAHRIFPAASDIRDGAGHVLVTSYAALRPDGQWSLLMVNKDQENAHTVNISFDDFEKKNVATFTGR